MSKKKQDNWTLPTIWDIIDNLSLSWLFAGEEKPDVRTRKEDGTYKGDDPSTPNVNEAWKSGKSPKKKGKVKK